MSTPPKTASLVVAHYKEDLSWLAEYAPLLHVYCKHEAHHDDAGTCSCYSVDAPKREHLANVGLEVHTYLTHIIEHYDAIADVVVFLKGHFTDAKPHLLNSVAQYIVEALDRGWAAGAPLPIVFRGRIEHWGKWRDALDSGRMCASPWTLDEFYRRVVGRDPPPVSHATYHGVFATTRERLLRYSREQYREWRSWIETHPNPETAHYFERMWYTLFAVGV
jgi:hypothetical protein